MNELLGGFSSTVWIFAKILVLIFLGLYSVFSLVIVRQVHLMTATLQIGLETTITILAYLHFVFAIGLLLIALFAL